MLLAKYFLTLRIKKGVGNQENPLIRKNTYIFIKKLTINHRIEPAIAV